ncbi:MULTISPECIES: DHA2 family efflux MFS transporter permease subunit [unclassified Paludibacterium]|uniref:DHA2 family efflux MFS transporter permease subunit n=1 Tax=unclassified Paludibacterium TaxID=2618429 RepID=UPI001C05A289|nr:DHA2 family efflux MFS transporter permease subunit [Paludibacterium sp. B53371]BEV71680.1 multidrug transporter subunit MdtD [Paludibacterium sp. THUN1379]
MASTDTLTAGVGPRPHDALPWLAATAFFMQMLDTTILNTALPAIATDLQRSPLEMESTVISYALTVALLIPLSGWLADRFGCRRVFMAAVGLFSLGSLLCALSGSLPMLVAMRVLQGVGGAMMMPVARLALLRSYPRSQFLAVMSTVTMPGLLGPVLGPLLGGWLVTHASWHWIFLINLPIGLVGLLMAPRVMSDHKAPHHPFDWPGFLLFAFALVGLSFGLDLIGAAHALVLALPALLAGSLLLLAYVRHARRHAEPLFDLAMFQTRGFRIGIFGNILCRLGTGGITLLIPLLLQVCFGYGADTAGWMLAPVALAAILAKPLITRGLPRIGYRRTLIVTSLLTVLSIASFALFAADMPLPWMLPSLVLFGGVSSMQMTAMNTLAVADLSSRHTSMGNTVLSVAQQLSVSFGLAISASALQLFHPAHVSQGAALTPAFRATFVLLSGLTLLSTLIFLRLKPQDGAAHAVRPVAAGGH